MMTKKEYQKTLIRIWDSMRMSDDSKGKPNCQYVRCSDCPMEKICSRGPFYIYDVIESVEKWAKEHPVKTNGSEFLKNYPKADIYDYDNGADGRVYIRLDRTMMLNDDNCISFPKTWWESEVDNND